MRRLLLCLLALTWPAAAACQTIVATDPDSTVDAYFTLRFDSLRLRPPKAPTVTSLAVAPKTATLQAGLTQTFAASASWSDGKPHQLTVTWTATGGTISSGGLYTAGASAGSYRVVASASGKADTARVTVTAAPPPPPPPDTTPPPPATCTPSVTNAAQWQAAIASGSSGTVWATGNFPGESYLKSTGKVFRACGRATLGNVYIQGAGNTLWGFEVTGGPADKMGINVRAPNTKLINNVVHHAGMSGIGMWTEAPNSEATGNLVYQNGTHAPGTSCYDHGIYAQGQTGTRLIRDNIIGQNLCYGVHLYAGAANQSLTGVRLVGNIVYGHTKWADVLAAVYLGPPASGIVLDSTFTWQASFGNPTADLGWVGGSAVKGKDLTYRWNYFVGQVQSTSKWTTVQQTGNVVVATKPTSNKVVVLPNPYEPGRANVAVYNWQGLIAVAVQVPGLAVGQAYTVQRATDFYGAPVVAGTYQGAILIPVGGEFGAFVVLPR